MGNTCKLFPNEIKSKQTMQRPIINMQWVSIEKICSVTYFCLNLSVFRALYMTWWCFINVYFFGCVETYHIPTAKMNRFFYTWKMIPQLGYHGVVEYGLHLNVKSRGKNYNLVLSPKKYKEKGCHIRQREHNSLSIVIRSTWQQTIQLKRTVISPPDGTIMK